MNLNFVMCLESSAITLNEEERKELAAALSGLTFATRCRAYTWNVSGWKRLELSIALSPKPPRTPTPRGLDEYLWSSPGVTAKSGSLPSAQPSGSASKPLSSEDYYRPWNS